MSVSSSHEFFHMRLVLSGYSVLIILLVRWSSHSLGFSHSVGSISSDSISCPNWGSNGYRCFTHSGVTILNWCFALVSGFLLSDTCLFVLLGRNLTISMLIYLAPVNSITLEIIISTSSGAHTELCLLLMGPSFISGLSLLAFLIFGCTNQESI